MSTPVTCFMLVSHLPYSFTLKMEDPLLIHFLLGLLFNPEDGSGMFLQNVS
jgi:hypothetical protein